MFIYTVLKPRPSPFHKTLDFINRLENIYVINNFECKDEKPGFVKKKKYLEGSRNIKKNIFKFYSTKKKVSSCLRTLTTSIS